jgi:hypothetical protein
MDAFGGAQSCGQTKIISARFWIERPRIESNLSLWLELSSELKNSSFSKNLESILP